MASSISVFLRDNNLLYELQSAFRSGHSTETALIRLTDQILKNMDNDEVTGLVFIDLRKAFDVIDHELLLKSCPSTVLPLLLLPGSNPICLRASSLFC